MTGSTPGSWRSGRRSSISCTGLFDDNVETPEDYRTLFERLVERRLPMVCANPDIVVERGDRLIYCAGALARLYGELGGEAILVGKPHAPIYAAAKRAVAALGGRRDARGRRRAADRHPRCGRQRPAGSLRHRRHPRRRFRPAPTIPTASASQRASMLRASQPSPTSPRSAGRALAHDRRTGSCTRSRRLATLPAMPGTGGVVAIGNFDGVHRGHQAVLAAARAEAEHLQSPLHHADLRAASARFLLRPAAVPPDAGAAEGGARRGARLGRHAGAPLRPRARGYERRGFRPRGAGRETRHPRRGDRLRLPFRQGAPRHAAVFGRPGGAATASR